MCEPEPEIVHLQAIAHFGTENAVPACWRTRFVMFEGGVEEVFGHGWLGGAPVHVSALPTNVTCPACRGLIQ